MFFDFDSQLFWQKLIFMTELVLAEILFTYKLKKRKGFALRAVFAVIADYAVAFVYPIFAYNAVATTALFLVLFAFSVGMLLLCYEENPLKIVFCGLIAYTTQHLAYDFNNLICTATGLDKGLTGMYGEELIGSVNGFTAIIYVDSYIVTYWLMWLLCGLRIKKEEEFAIKSFALMWLAAVILLVDVILSVVISYSIHDGTEKVWIVVAYLYNIISCGLSAFLQFGLANYKRQAGELDTVKNILFLQSEQYRASRETIDLINIKCHDLRHQIRVLRKGEGQVDKDMLKDIERTVRIYDTAVKTGNEALDVILTEKSLQCEKSNIRLCCVANGEKLNFMTPSDIYSLFGNALENAIEAVEQLPDDGDGRVINLSVKGIGKLLSVQVDNYCATEPKIENGMPVSSKKDSDYHGFGTRSMKYIAEKYDGDISFAVRDKIFTMNLLLPVSDVDKE